MSKEKTASEPMLFFRDSIDKEAFMLARNHERTYRTSTYLVGAPADQAVEVLDAVGRLEGRPQLREHTQPMQRRRLFEALIETGRCRRVSCRG
jgi:hypothetical protein